MTDNYASCGFGEGTNIVDENDEMDALGSILSWDDGDEAGSDADAQNDLAHPSSTRVGVNMNDGQNNQDGSNYMYNNAFLAKLKAQIAANSNTSNSRAPSGVVQIQLPASQQQLGNSDAQQQQVQQQVQQQQQPQVQQVQQQQHQQVQQVQQVQQQQHQQVQQVQQVQQHQQQAQQQHQQAQQPPSHQQQQQQLQQQQPQQQPPQQQQQQQPPQQQVQVQGQQVQQQPQSKKQQQVPHQPQFAQNFIPNYLPPPNPGGNYQQVYTTHLAQPAPTQNGPPIYTQPSYGMVTHPSAAAQQQAEIRPNVYSQVQQQLNPDFIRSLQQHMSVQMRAHVSQSAIPNQNQQQQQQQQQHQQHQHQHQQPTMTMPPGLKVLTMNGVNSNNIVGAQPTHMPIQPSLATVPQAQSNNDAQINTLKKPMSSSSLNKQGKQVRKKNVTASKTAMQLSIRGGSQPIVSCSDTDNDGMSISHKRSGTDLDVQTNNNNAVPDTDLNPEEKAKANRDRNREHARNTRLRKKAYLEKLKTTVDELCKERDALVSERSGKASLLVEKYNTRTEVLLSFFSLRSSNEQRRQLWSSILDDGCFQCVLPVTPYRSFPASEVQISKSQRTILGIDGMMADTASLHVLLSSLVDRSLHPEGKIQFRYTLISEDAVVSGNQMMTRWSMTTVNAVENGAKMEVSKRGMLSCKFSSSHTIVSLEIMFDVMAFMLQLKQSRGSQSFAVIPNTIQTSQRPYTEPMVVTNSDSPYTIVQVNHLWENMSGYRANEVIGKHTPRILQGKETNRKDTETIMEAVRYRRPCQVTVLNYTKQGKKFLNFLSVYPLGTDSKITHYLGLSHHVKMLKEEEKKKTVELKSTNAEQQQRESSLSATSATVSSITSKSSTSMSSKGSGSPQKNTAANDSQIRHKKP